VSDESEERMKMLNPFLFLIIVLGLATLACSELTIVNQSPAEMRVMVRLPEGNGVDSQVIKIKSSLTFYSDIEGPYSVSVIPTDEAIGIMDRLRIGLKRASVEDPEALKLTGKSIPEALEFLYGLEVTLKNIQVASCSGRLIADEETIVTIGFDGSSAKFIVICP